MNRFIKIRTFASIKEGRVLSAREFARILDIDPGTVTKVESEEINPSPKMARALAEKYEISQEWFLTGEGYAPWEMDFEAMGYFEFDEKGQAASAFLSVLATLSKSPQRDLVKYIVRLGRDSKFREYIYNFIDRSGIVDMFLELQQLKRELAELRVAVPEPVTVSPPAVTPRPNSYQHKTAPAIRLTADQTFESTEVELEQPAMPAELNPEEARRWEINLTVLKEYAASEQAKKDWPRRVIPSGVAARFCREVVGFYAGGSNQDVGGMLWEFLLDTATQYTGRERRKHEA